MFIHNWMKWTCILTIDSENCYFIHVAEANKMANVMAVVSFGQNRKLQMINQNFLPPLGINLHIFVTIHAYACGTCPHLL